MAAIHTWVHFRGSDRPDGLCPKCFNPTLMLYVLERIDLDGITMLGERVACADCRIWLSQTRTEGYPHAQNH